jgi:hypothetical protein
MLSMKRFQIQNPNLFIDQILHGQIITTQCCHVYIYLYNYCSIYTLYIILYKSSLFKVIFQIYNSLPNIIIYDLKINRNCLLLNVSYCKHNLSEVEFTKFNFKLAKHFNLYATLNKNIFMVLILASFKLTYPDN